MSDASNGTQRIVPMIAYEDAAAAIDWLVEAFGFRELTRMADEDGRIGHAELELGGGIVYLASPTPDYCGPRRHREVCEPARKWSAVPWVIDGVMVQVDDADAHFRRAKAAGAAILSEPEDQPYGRIYRAEDHEGHRWMFIQPPAKVVNNSLGASLRAPPEKEDNMAVQPKPEGYHTVTPYFIVPGAADFIEFLKQAFGADERMRMGPEGKIMHAEVRIGDSIVMLGDASVEFEPTRSATHLYVDDVDAMYQRAIQAGGESLREPTDQFYGDRSAGVKDRFGNDWWLATHVEDVSPEEMQRRQAAMAQA